MSMAFASNRRQEPTQQTIQSLLDENTQLIQAIVDYQNKGKAYECQQYQQILHRNLVYLATLADSNQGPMSGSGNSQAPLTPGKPQTSTITPASMMSPQPSSVMSTSPVDSMQSMPTVSPSMQPGVPEMTPNSITSTAMTSASSGYGPPMSAGNLMVQSSAPLSQLQHQSMPGQNPIGYSNPQSQASRSSVPSGIGGALGGMPGQSQVAPQSSQISQHMMPQGGQQPSPQQYLMQQRQMQQYRQSTPQQLPGQQQQLSHNPAGYNHSSSGMLPSYPQQQAPHYNPYRPSPQQPSLSHMPYPQQPQTMQGQPVMGPMGQSPMPPPQV